LDKTSPPAFEQQVKSIQQLIQTTKFNDAIKQSKQLQKQTTDPQQQIELWYLIAVAQRYAKTSTEALSSINALLKLDEQHSRANQEQGFINLALDEPIQAKISFEKAVALNPSLVASWQALIHLYRDAEQQQNVQKAANQLEKLKKLPPALLAVTELMHERKLLKAEQICRHFLQQNKRHIDGMCMLAEIGIELKIYDDAEFLLASAIELAPTHIHARSQYLNLLLRLGKYKIAAQQVEQLLLVQPDNLSFKIAKASALTGLGEIAQAITLFEQAIAENDQIPGFHLQLGHALKTKGDIEKAVVAYQKAYQLSPSYGDAFWSLANTKTYRFSDAEIANMQAQQDNKDLALTDKIQLHFATGKAFEDRQEYKLAFQAYQQGNKLQHDHSGFDISKIEQQVAEQIKYCTAELFEKRGHLGLNSPDPIFIVGLPRAGSTLLEQILASHSQVDGTMELHNILGLASRLRGRNNSQNSNPSATGNKSENESTSKGEQEGQYPKNLSEINPDYFTRFGQQFIDETQVYREQAPLFIDKMPNNFLHIGLIRLILPNAKIIDARRSPMACCFSGFKQLFAEGQDFSYDLEDIGRYYQAYLKLMAHWDKVLPGFVLTVKHEDVVDDLATQVRRMLDFCGLEFEQSCVDFHKTKRNIKTPSSEQVRQPIYKSATEQWRHFEQYLTPLKNIVAV